MANRFADCETIDEVLGRGLGLSDIDWENTEVLASTDIWEVVAVVDEMKERILNIVTERLFGGSRKLPERPRKPLIEPLRSLKDTLPKPPDIPMSSPSSLADASLQDLEAEYARRMRKQNIDPGYSERNQ